ncbi:hypothetical protein NQ314_018319 [Rhamnusium bicolor]|uniref:C2H2-type domain-containing protein n=1 Tax=Rhamnusium bicolor TaxID=1586634 RepID=A0AAV8WQK7_9CUCU|nr:hypothetical protein NQ314_018319 [Rhamnusium bicolor]
MKLYKHISTYQESVDTDSKNCLNNDWLETESDENIIKYVNTEESVDIDRKNLLKEGGYNNQSECENIVVNTVKYSCEKCGDCYLLKSGFQQHMFQKHTIKVINFETYSSKITIKMPKTEIFECPVNKKTDLQNNLECKKCHCIFKTHSELDEHYNTHKKYICGQCGVAFITKSRLIDHIEIHSTNKRHTCNICGKLYRRRSTLVRHKRLHSNLRPLMCETCGQSFNDGGTLKTHIKLKHTNERNFQCSVCGISFAMKSCLNKHMLRRHNGKREKNHVCSICGIAYFEKKTLNNHISVKHGGNGKKHSCGTCKKQYTTKTNLMKHIRNYHGVKTNTESDLTNLLSNTNSID